MHPHLPKIVRVRVIVIGSNLALVRQFIHGGFVLVISEEVLQDRHPIDQL